MKIDVPNQNGNTKTMSTFKRFDQKFDNKKIKTDKVYFF